MSAINIATQIPSNINTLERLAAWSLLTLGVVNPNKVYLETPQDSILIVQSSTIQAGDDTSRLLLRVALELDEDFVVSNLPLWMSAKEISNSQIPAAYLRQ